MPGNQQIEREIQSVEALYNFLVDQICNQIDEVNARFRGYIGMMAETGVPEEECTRFTNEFYAVDESNLKAIYNRIVEADLPQIKNYLENLARQYQAATNNSYGSLSLHYPNPVSTQTPSAAVVRSNNNSDYEVQIDALCDFMGFLVDERNKLRETIQTYQNYCNNMLENGVPRQLVDHYVTNFASPNVGHINNKIISHIQQEDYTQLMGLYTQVVESLKSIGMSPNRSPQSM
jgi:hypothetical protein